jgi:hypothetical protein
MGMLLVLVGFGVFVVVLYKAAIYALPVALGLESGYWATTHGLGGMGGVIAGVFVGASVFVAGQLVFGASRSRVVRSVVALLFVLPAIIAGYAVVLDLAQLGGMASNPWCHAFAVMGAGITGWVAFARLAQSPNAQLSMP